MSLQRRIKRAERALGAETEIERGALLRGLMRYFLVQRHLATVVPLGHKTQAEMTPAEWQMFVALSVRGFNSRPHGYWTEAEMLHYIGATPETLPAFFQAFMRLPDRSDYEQCPA
jgi:hypothetical protein